MKLAGTSESNFQFSDIKGCEVIELNFDSSESDSDQKEDQWDVLDTGEELFKFNLKVFIGINLIPSISIVSVYVVLLNIFNH